MNQKLPKRETMYQALLDKDSSYEGIFFAAIVTTGIFCRPTCTARKPKKKNVEFFASTREALLHGYRPCKICKPMEYPDDIPDWLQPVLADVTANPEIRLKDYHLRLRHIDPNRLRRWFKKHHGITFQAYQRALRISKAFDQIKYGDKVAEAAFDSGFESLSGFTERFRKTTGFAPGESKKRNIILITRMVTPLGPMIAGATENGICLLEFSDRPMLETQIKRIKKIFNSEIIPGSSPHFILLHQQLHSYFKGELKLFTVPLVIDGTPFQEKVWNMLLKIPYGSNRSYKKQAEMIGQPEAVRAVAKANGDNRISVIIPCHRVIGSDGSLTGYGGGLWRKKYLLELETKNL